MDGDGPASVQAAGLGTVGKALDVLDRVALFGRPVRFSELLAACDYPKPTLHRLLQTLTRQGMLSHDPDAQVYTLGLRLVRLAHAAWTQSSLITVARPHLDALSRRIGETVHLAQLDNGHVLYVDKRNAARPVAMYSEAGKIGPAYCTGIGKAMLAFLDAPALEAALSQQAYQRFTDNTLGGPDALRAECARVRARGYALDREEHEIGIVCVALPIRTGTGRVLGGLSVTGSTARTDLAALEALVPVMAPVAARIGQDAESWRFPDAGRDLAHTGGTEP